MRSVSYAELDRPAWDGLCDRSGSAWIFHRHRWIEIESRFPGVENCSFALATARDEIVGVMPCYLQALGLGAFTERLLHSGLHRHTGLALADGLADAEVREAQRLAMARVFAVARVAGADRIQLNLQNLAPDHRRDAGARVPFWVEQDGFDLGVQTGPAGLLPAPGMATLAADQLVDLAGRSRDELFAGLDSAARRAVRKARKSGLTARALEPGEAAEVFRRLALRSAERTGETLAAPAYHEALARLGGTDVTSQVWLAEHEGSPVAAVWLLVHKRAAHFLAGASDPDRLALRGNDFVHWAGIEWAHEIGCEVYRLGPIFPELPADWPVARVSRFKKKFGGRSLPIVQGSFFLHPERYRPVAEQAVSARLEAARARAAERSESPPEPVPLPRIGVALEGAGPEDLDTVLRSYGGLDLPLRFGPAPEGSRTAVLSPEPSGLLPPGIAAEPREPGAVYRDREGEVVYRALLPHCTFTGSGLRPVWTDTDGRALLALHDGGSRRTLLVGLDVVGEMVRHRQGDPDRATSDGDRTAFGFEFERPNYLFEGQLGAEHRGTPFADRLGFTLVEELARLAGAALVEPLPNGSRGLVLLTGDDDQAELERYTAQQKLLRGTPITYYLVPQTRHTPDSLARLRPPVAFGLHVDALESPDEYDRLCAEQTALLRGLTRAPCRSLRNHGFLNRGYLGHLGAWEANGILLDVNLPGVDGTVLNGSLLPMRVRRPDGSWSEHRTLLTAFGDGMLQALSMSERQAVERIRELADRVERTRPGVLVFNFHPQNLPGTRNLHRCIRRLARRRGWEAWLVEDYLDWLLALDGVALRHHDGGCSVRSPAPIEGLVLRCPTADGWRRVVLGRVEGEREVRFP